MQFYVRFQSNFVTLFPLRKGVFFPIILIVRKRIGFLNTGVKMNSSYIPTFTKTKYNICIFEK
jgi:hypothetical protein